MEDFRRDFTKTGSEFTRTGNQKKKLNRVVNNLNWVKPEGEYALAPGMAIKSLISGFKLKAVSALSHSPEYSPLGLIAVRNHFKNGMTQIYAIDNGLELIPIAIDFYENKEQ